MTLQELHDATKELLADGIDPNTAITVTEVQPECNCGKITRYINGAKWVSLEEGFKRPNWEYYSLEQSEFENVPTKFITVE